MDQSRIFEIIVTLALGTGALTLYVSYGVRLGKLETFAKDLKERIDKLEISIKNDINKSELELKERLTKGENTLISSLIKVEELLDKRIEKNEQNINRNYDLILKQEFAEFENKFLERLNGRYLQTKIAETIIKRSDERYEQIMDQLQLLKEQEELRVKSLKKDIK